MNSPLHTLIQTLYAAITIGSLYALIAIGYTLVFGILQFINFAHGDVFALGAWLTYAVAAALSRVLSPLPMAFLVPIAAIAGCALVGFCIERFAYRPLRSAPRLNVLITAIGVSLLLENAGLLPWAFGPNPRQSPAIIPDRVLATVVGVDLHLTGVMVVAIALILMIALQLLIFRTRFGMAMRAVSINTPAAALMGINVDRVISITFVIGSALAGAAGVLYTMNFQLEELKITSDASWLILGLKAFIAAVVGGIGNVRGALLGGLLIGIIENAGTAYISSNYRNVYVFAVLILVLLIRPTGILGKPLAETA